MTWNWEHDDWPQFNYKKFDEWIEADFLRQAGFISGFMCQFDGDTQSTIHIDIMSNEAIKSSEIEGELLDRESVQSSFKRHFSLGTGCHSDNDTIADMMANVYKTYDDDLSHTMIKNWHRLLMKHNKTLSPGSYRSGDDTMQIVSGPITRPVVHFEAPPSCRVSDEMKTFIGFFNASKPGTEGAQPALIRASIAHLYFESIHPFEDGNGRIGRALVKKIISQHTNAPALISLSEVILKDRKNYYKHLHEFSRTLDIGPWIHYFSKIILDAQLYTYNLIDFILFKIKIFNSDANDLNERQIKFMKRVTRDGHEGFLGHLSAKKYMKITAASRATATRDLRELVEMDVLTRTGELKSTRYHLNWVAKQRLDF